MHRLLNRSHFSSPFTAGWQLCATTTFWGDTNDNVLPCCTTSTICLLLPIRNGGENQWYNSKWTQSERLVFYIIALYWLWKNGFWSTQCTMLKLCCSVWHVGVPLISLWQLWICFGRALWRTDTHCTLPQGAVHRDEGMVSHLVVRDGTEMCSCFFIYLVCFLSEWWVLTLSSIGWWGAAGHMPFTKRCSETYYS